MCAFVWTYRADASLPSFFMHLSDTTFEDLCILETEREAQKINNMARLVGGQDLTSSLNVSTAEINNSGIMRCTSCPRSSFTHPFVLVLTRVVRGLCDTMYTNCHRSCVCVGKIVVVPNARYTVYVGHT